MFCVSCCFLSLHPWTGAPVSKRLSCEFQEVIKGELMVVKATYECFGDFVCSEYTSLKMC